MPVFSAIDPAMFKPTNDLRFVVLPNSLPNSIIIT